MTDQRNDDAASSRRRALDESFSLAYEELRRLAAVIRREDPGATINPTALVNEAWFKLAGSPSLGALPRVHFVRIAARAMRQLLVEAARRRHASKRGGGVQLATLDESKHPSAVSAGQLLALDDALAELARVDRRQATMVEMRFFGGLSVAETAQALEISEATVNRDWRVARAWLAIRLRDAGA